MANEFRNATPCDPAQTSTFMSGLPLLLIHIEPGGKFDRFFSESLLYYKQVHVHVYHDSQGFQL